MSTDLVIATKQVHQQIDEREQEFRTALPDHIPVTKFRRVLLTAISKDPDLLAADRISLFQAAMDCAQDGLLPDGKEAALVVFKTKVKRGGVEVYVKAVTYMPMVRGILKRMRNSGMVKAPTAQLVYRKDHFKYWVDDDGQHLQHEFDAFSDRGEIVGVYARAKTMDGEVHLEVMSVAEVEYIRQTFSRQPDGPMWKKSWGEAAKKTILHRLSKVLPCSTDLELTFERGDGDLPQSEALPPPAPAIADFHTAAAIDAGDEADPDEPPSDPEEEDESEPEGELYRVIDVFGCVEYEGGDQKQALATLQTMLDQAGDQIGRDHLREANPDLASLLASPSANGEDGTAQPPTSSPAGPAAEPAPPRAKQPATPLWDAGSPRKVAGKAIFGLGNISPPRHARYFPTVAAWCAALCELADVSSDEDAIKLWETNSTVHSAMVRDYKTDIEQAHLKGAAEHFAPIFQGKV